jgi:hypothetical protein
MSDDNNRQKNQKNTRFGDSQPILQRLPPNFESLSDLHKQLYSMSKAPYAVDALYQWCNCVFDRLDEYEATTLAILTNIVDDNISTTGIELEWREVLKIPIDESWPGLLDDKPLSLFSHPIILYFFMHQFLHPGFVNLFWQNTRTACDYCDELETKRPERFMREMIYIASMRFDKRLKRNTSTFMPKLYEDMAKQIYDITLNLTPIQCLISRTGIRRPAHVPPSAFEKLTEHLERTMDVLPSYVTYSTPKMKSIAAQIALFSNYILKRKDLIIHKYFTLFDAITQYSGWIIPTEIAGLLVYIYAFPPTLLVMIYEDIIKSLQSPYQSYF